MKFKVDPAIFAKFPGVRIGVVVVFGMDNTKGGEKIVELLREEEKEQNTKLANADFNQIAETAGWKEIYRQFGSNPRDFRPSVEALLRRVRTGNPLPSINPLVDVYNLLSIRHSLPAGAEDLDKTTGDITLGFAKGTEKGKYIGSDEVSVCDVGEVVYRDQVGFICRKWNWREGDRTKIDEQTKNAVVVFEALPVVSDEVLETAMAEAEKLIQANLGDLSNLRISKKILRATDTELEIDFESGKKTEIVIARSKETKQSSQLPEAAISGERVVFHPAENPLAKIDIRSELVKELSKSLYKSLLSSFPDAPLNERDMVWEHPKNDTNGDYSTNVAMRWQRLIGKNIGKRVGEFTQAQNKDALFATPYDLAVYMKENWVKVGLPKEVERVEVAGAGFINVWLTKEYFVKQASVVLADKESYGNTKILAGRKILLEHTSPNPQTTIMLGHLRNNFLGMTTARLLENAGAEVKLDCIVNDRGVHLCRSIFGYLFFADKEKGLSRKELVNFKEVNIASLLEAPGSHPGASERNWREWLGRWVGDPGGWWMPEELGKKSDHANLIWYVLGSRAYKEIDGVEAQVDEILKAWEANDESVRKIWKMIIGWSEAGYAQTYKRVSSKHDKYWYESDHWQEGKDIVESGLKSGVFGKSEGAVVTDLAKFGLTDTVVIKSDGTGLYMTQDLALTRLKLEKFKADLYIWVIGAEQTLYVQQLFKVVEQLGMARVDQLFHLGFALINFKGGGKMATRKGDVVMADEVLDLLKFRAKEIMSSSNQANRGELGFEKLDAIAEQNAVGALKYSLLKYSRETTMQFDIDESLALEGNSAPYIQYTYARAKSVLAKSNIKDQISKTEYKLTMEELAILRSIYRYPEVILEATINFAPNLICNYLYDVAQKFNSFYDKQRIINSDNEGFRLRLTAAVAQLIKNGLRLLGIATPERM